MNLPIITDNVYYAGCDDRVTDLFERLWPLPEGVTYNSYLVCGEKNALIECIELSEVEALIKNIKAHLGDNASLDYVVINHMEPDHSGGIPALISEFPEIKIVGNDLTVKMIRGFYHINDDSRFHIVKNGDILDLGNEMVLKFILTPMVHWPETMMTWLENKGVLFSGDAFGMFGALNGGVLDSDSDLHAFPSEMYRYYSNIVGKYGKFVQSALAKTADLDIKYICSTHGPVWHERISDVVDIYSRLSKYEPEDGVVIVYGSMYGTTARLADRIAAEFASKGVKNIRVHDASHTPLSFLISDAFRYRNLIIGSATYQMGLFPPVEALLRALEAREIKNKVLGVFSSHAWAPGMVDKAVKAYADRMNLEISASLGMKQNMRDEIEPAISGFVDSILNAGK